MPLSDFHLEGGMYATQPFPDFKSILIRKHYLQLYVNKYTWLNVTQENTRNYTKWKGVISHSETFLLTLHRSMHKQQDYSYHKDTNFHLHPIFGWTYTYNISYKPLFSSIIKTTIFDQLIDFNPFEDIKLQILNNPESE